MEFELITMGKTLQDATGLIDGLTTNFGFATDEATDRVIAELDKMIKEYSKKAPGMVEGIPEFKRQASREGYIEYNPISVQKLGVLIAGALGFKNKEAFIDFVSHDPESVEAQVFDNEFSL